MLRDDPLRTGLLAAVVLAALAAAWFGFSWLSAAQDGDVAYARERDTVLQVAGRGLVTLHAVDHRAAARDVDRWLEVTTGELHADLDGERDGQIKQARSIRAVSKGKLLQAAVTDLDANAGRARVIAVLDVQLSRKGAKAKTERRRVNAELLRSDDGWRISAVEPAA